MALTPAQITDLQALLFRAVVRIAAGSGWGSGVVVGPGRVLTARHVVESALDGRPVTVGDSAGGTYEGTVVEERGPGWPDLAVLSVPGATGLPAAVLDGAAVPLDAAQRLIVGGYPSGTQVTYQTRAFTSGGEQNVVLPAAGGPPGTYLRLDGDPLMPGMSGGPVVDLVTGFLCGIVQKSIDPRNDVGGFAVTGPTILGQLPSLRAGHDRPGPAAAEWVALLGPVHLRGQRRDADGSRWDTDAAVPRLDLRVVAGGPSLPHWTVSVAEPASEARVTVGDLGGDMIEALDRWSRRRLLESRAEAELLGGMLWKALLPDPLPALLAPSTAGPTLVRVRVDRDDRLAGIPWEYARSAAGKPLATDPALAFGRYVEQDPRPVPPRERLRVLAVTACPPAVAARIPARVSRGGTARLSGGEELAEELRRAVLGRPRSRAAVDLTVAADVSLDDLDGLLRDGGPWDAVHYLGLGWEYDDGAECTLAFADGSGDVVAAPVDSVVEKLADAGCPLVVVQLLSPPMDRPGPVLGPIRLLPVLERGAQALVVAQHAATNQHVTGFAARFYDELAAGRSVEVAVQLARKSMLDSPPQLDYTAFGTVTVTTTRDGDVRLVTPAPAATGAGRGGISASQYGGPR